MEFDINQFSVEFMIFYFLLGAVIYKTFQLPTRLTGMLLVGLVAVAIIHETADTSRYWIVVSLIEMFIGGVIASVINKFVKNKFL